MILGCLFLKAEAKKEITNTTVLKFISRRFAPQLGTSSVTKFMYTQYIYLQEQSK